MQVSRNRRFPLALALYFIFIAACAAQMPASAPLDANARKTVITKLADELRARYVFPEKGIEAGETIKGNLASGAYDKLDDARVFAQTITTELQGVTHDKHMRLMLAPRMAAQPDPGKREEMLLRGGAHENFGFVKVERLPGNVGYIDMRQFFPADAGGATAIAAMNFVANCDAVIFDLRQNGGGDPTMIQLISSYLFDKRTHLNDLYWREGNRTEEFWTHEKVEGKRMANTPVYVLTSRRTFSGAEEFTNNLKMLKRAKIIGETTGGGANPGDTFPVALGMVAFIPTGRAVNPISHSNWEGTGVEPDEKMPAPKAFDAAYEQALRTIEQNAKDPEAKMEAAWIRSGLELKSKGAPPSSADLQRYAGKYGDRMVTFENGALYSQRGPGPKTRLVPLNTDTFSFEGMDMARLQFTADGQATKAIVNYADGRKEEATRD